MNTAVMALWTPYCAPCTWQSQPNCYPCLALTMDCVRNLADAGSLHRITDCPCRFDTQLTELGRRQAAAKAAATSRLSPAPEVLLISPLRRTLQTAELAFPQANCPRVVEPLARERIWLSSDVGTARCSVVPGMQPCTAFALMQCLSGPGGASIPGALQSGAAVQRCWHPLQGCILLSMQECLQTQPRHQAIVRAAVCCRSELERQWPGHDFSQLEEVWWTTDAPDNPEAVCSETSGEPLPRLV